MFVCTVSIAVLGVSWLLLSARQQYRLMYGLSNTAQLLYIPVKTLYRLNPQLYVSLQLLYTTSYMTRSNHTYQCSSCMSNRAILVATCTNNYTIVHPTVHFGTETVHSTMSAVHQTISIRTPYVHRNTPAVHRTVLWGTPKVQNNTAALRHTVDSMTPVIDLS